MRQYTFSKHIKFRKEADCLLICDCKLLRDFKVEFEFENFLNAVNKGIKENTTHTEKERLLLKDFHSMRMLSAITIRPIPSEAFQQTDRFMEQQLYHGKRPRTYEFLLEKCKENPTLFLGLYLDDELIGVIQGFPRDDYLLMSELAVDTRFRKRSFGAQLVKAFETNAKKLNYTKIKLGAEDTATLFYYSLGYKPSLFLQVPEKKQEEVINKLKKDKQEILGISLVNHLAGIELVVDSLDQTKLASLKKQFSPVSAQFLFSKDL
ncbi:MAG: GNAT family N-acetyltransferase [Candidatus Woesearchaeota archaeon]|nr:GNAT family N-acetyltransferase [Candidatus Woesearchaeota archaeon]